MANLINTDYFINDIHIPKDEKPLVGDVFAKSITRYENEILDKLLGYPLRVAMLAGAESEPYKSLIEGADFSFEFNGQTINTHWNGLTNTELISLIAYYVYYKHRENFDSNYSGTGETKNKNENSKVISPMGKMVNAWNEMVDLYGQTPLYLMKYGGYFLNQDSYAHYNAKPSAYNYLLANKDDFSDWIFTPIRKVNAFGI